MWKQQLVANKISLTLGTRGFIEVPKSLHPGKMNYLVKCSSIFLLDYLDFIMIA